MKKKLLSFVLSFALLFGTAAALPEGAFNDGTGITASAANTPTSGKCGKNVNWTLDSDGVLTISGKGKMDDYVSNTSPFYNRNDIISVVIKSGVTSIGSTAFYECDNLTSVTIPNSVTSIGVGVFVHCSSLASINIPSSITSIDKGAFFGCTSLKSVTIPGSVTSIGEQAFLGCFSLTSIIIPNSVNSIGELAFYDCYRLTSVTIPQSVTQIGKEALGYTYGVKVDGFTICAKKGTAAEKYAKDNGFKFVAIPKSIRLSGSSRYETAAKIADEVKAQGSVDRVFLVNADKFADALAGVPLAVNQNAAILLASKTELPDATLAEIKKLGVKNITILGGNSAVGKEAVEDKLTKQGYNVTRIKGSTRYETATNIAEKVNSAPTAVFVVYSQKFPDALGISSIAAKMKAPILYVDKKGTIDANTKAYLTKHKSTIKKAYVIGGKGAVSDDVKSQVDKTLGITSVRISGSTRYETCTNVLQYSDFKSYVNGNAICVTTGEKFPDALAGGILAAKTNAPVLLVNKTLDATQKAYLAKKKAETSGGIASVYILGGKSAVPEAVKDAIYNAVK